MEKQPGAEAGQIRPSKGSNRKQTFFSHHIKRRAGTGKHQIVLYIQ